MPAYYSNYRNRPSCIYRLFDDSGALLYIGLTMGPENRICRHRGSQPWGKQIAHSEVEWFDDRESAKSAERLAIRDERPIHNRMHPRVECP